MSLHDEHTPPELERDIAHTRSKLTQTLDALEHRLDARPYIEKGLDMFNNRILGSEGLNRGLDAIRDNPIPAALIGIGAAWLAASSSGLVDRVANDQRVGAARRRVSDFADSASGMASSVASTVGFGGGSSTAEKPLGHTGHPLVDQPHTPTNRNDGWMHQVSDAAQGTWRSARDAIEGPVSYATGGANRIADRLTDAFDDHPLAIGAVGVMAGILVAALVPMTRTETDLLGDT